MNSKYRIESVEITGFKGFANSQTVPIDGKTTFIFGTNGLGKSSIIEAVVWCLYGTEIDVRNKLYQGSCSVNLTLKEYLNPSKMYRIERRMHPGDNGSEVVVIYPDGERKNITDFLPQLKKLEHGPGTRVIFAEQEAGKRYSHGLNDFEGLIAAYLGLDVLYSVIDWLGDFIKGEEIGFDEKIRSRERKLSEEVKRRSDAIKERIGFIIQQTPWQTPLPPTEQQTLESAESFHNDIVSMMGENTQAEASPSLDQLLDTCSLKLVQLENASKSRLIQMLETLESNLNTAAELRNQLQEAIERVKNSEFALAESKSNLAQLLGGKTESEIIDEKETLRKSQGILAHKAVLLTEAKVIISHDATLCPVCNSSFESEQLQQRVHDSASQISASEPEVQRKINSVTKILESIASTNSLISLLAVSIAVNNQKIADAEAKLSRLFGIQQINVGTIDAKIAESKLSAKEIRTKIDDQTAKLVTLREQLMKLRQTAEYHRLIKSLSRLEAFSQSEEYLKLHAKMVEFETYAESLRIIHSKLEDNYVKAFSSYLPGLSKEMTDVYRLLTRQKSFDTVRIIDEASDPLKKAKRKMVLQVGSLEKGVWVTPETVDVLNGQSRSALSLVPYFAFSRMGMSQHEINFLLIDDPSQSFDTSHIDYLLDLMKSVAESAQVIIASHERDRIENMLEKYFLDYIIISVNGFDVENGPKFSSTIITNNAQTIAI